MQSALPISNGRKSQNHNVHIVCPSQAFNHGLIEVTVTFLLVYDLTRESDFLLSEMAVSP